MGMEILQNGNDPRTNHRDMYGNHYCIEQKGQFINMWERELATRQ